MVQSRCGTTARQRTVQALIPIQHYRVPAKMWCSFVQTNLLVAFKLQVSKSFLLLHMSLEENNILIYDELEKIGIHVDVSNLSGHNNNIYF